MALHVTIVASMDTLPEIVLKAKARAKDGSLPLVASTKAKVRDGNPSTTREKAKESRKAFGMTRAKAKEKARANSSMLCLPTTT